MRLIHFHYWGVLASLALASLSTALVAQEPLSAEITRQDTQVTISWPKVEGRDFTVQWTDRLQGGSWVNGTPSVPWPMGGVEWSDPQALDTLKQRFYRVLSVEPTERGRVMEVVPGTSYSQALIKMLVSGYLPDMASDVQYGVDTYVLTYETVDPFGGKTYTSGLMCLLQECAQPRGMLSFQHGTLVKKSDAPSTSPTSIEPLVCVLSASMGFASVATDYLGLGTSPGFHPYCHAVSEATAAIDILRAGRTYCESIQVTPKDQLFLLGYSQGGQSTMSLHREIEKFYSDEFKITASAPMAGPYDVSGTMVDDFLSGRAFPNPYFFPYLFKAYQGIYGFADSFEELLAPPYDTVLPPLLDGYHSGDQINKVMPSDARLILKPEFLEALISDPDHPLRVAARDNDTCFDWAPKAPMQLWHSSGDKDVIQKNSLVAIESFREKGVDVPLNDPVPTLGHVDAAITCMGEGLEWFLTFE